MLQRSTPKGGTNILFLEVVRLSGLKLQNKVLEETAKKKAAMEAARARGEKTSYREEFSLQGKQLERLG